MQTRHRKYRAIISSDWNECLAPCGPFDFVSFTYPSLEPEVKKIFKAYTGNEIPLSEAVKRIFSLFRAPVTEEQMDAYLDASFETYRGVPEMIEWCEKKDILFMINTTGVQGYFQRVFAKGLLPDVPVVSAHPMIKYEEQGGMPCRWYDLLEIQDKPENTQMVLGEWGIPPEKAVLIGDSGGDGPHFEWGAKIGASLIGSMTKWSLDQYCSKREIKISLHFGLCYSKGEKRNKAQEMDINFMDLATNIEAIL
jgi:2-hydroxy-3-keto-5-methylthiopentenyl-1-phosphate phosphatase